MEQNENNEENPNNNLYLNDIIKKFLSISELSENDKIIINKVKPILFLYFKRIIELYINNIDDKTIKIIKKPKRKFNYIIKLFINNIIGKHKYINLSNQEDFSNKIFIFLIIFCFIIFREVCIYKSDVKYKDIKDLVLEKLDILLSKILIFISKLYTDKIIVENNLELSLKLLITLSISLKTNEEPNKNDKIVNMMFFKECINTIKIVFTKIYESQKKYTENQEKLLNNIILFIRENVIDYSNKKPISIFIKSYLSHNDYNTSSLIELIFIISKMNNIEIINNYIELLTNIYSFSFRYNNMMSPLIKILEPLLININKKQLDEINYEINISKFPIQLLNGLIEKEATILKEDPTLLKSGFYLGNKISGISSELDSLGDDFLLIFGFSLHEINNDLNKINKRKEWTLVNIRNKEKDKASQIKIWLSQIENIDNKYNLLISIKNKVFQTKIIIVSKKTYIFSFHFIKKTLKICYTSQSDAYPINEIEEINIQSFNTNNTNIYIGCDINNSINLIKEDNTFTGFIGTIIIINQKKLAKKNPEDISKLILSLRGDYASIINMSLENKEYKSSLISNENKYNNYKNVFLYNQVHDKIIQLNEKSPDSLKFVESIKALISPNSFRLVEYKDEVDYLNLKNNYEFYEYYKKENISIKQNFLDFKQKDSSSKNDKMINIFSSFFNNRFHIFENKNSLEEFIKYDGIYYLCLLLEYYYQIICKLIDSNSNKNNNPINLDINDIYLKIENNIYEIFEFFYNKIINKQFCKNFIKEINHFLYQMSLILKKYMTINNINTKFLEIILSLIKTFINYIQDEKTEDSSDFINEIKQLRNHLLELLNNLCLYFYDDTEFTKIEFYINTINNLLINKYLNDLFSVQFLEQLLSLTFIFDESISYIKKNKLLFKKIQTKYAFLLSQFLIISYYDFCANIQNENKNDQKRGSKLSKNEEKSKDEKKNFEYLNYYIEYSLQTENSPYIFANLLNVLCQSELIENIQPRYMEEIKYKLEQNYKHITENKKSQLISESTLRILSAYYLSDKKKEKLLHNFLKGLKFHKGFFNSIIASLRQIKYITNENKFIKTESEKTLRKISVVSSEDNDSTHSAPLEKNYISNNDDLFPLLNLDLDSLNKKQNHLLIALIQDCISMLFIGNTTDVYDYITESDAQEIYDILIKNLNAVFKFPGKNVYKDIFSSDKEIAAELFYFKWKLSNNESRKVLINDIKRFHKELIKYHSFPFIFKFILLINLEEQNVEEKKENNINDDNDENNLIIDLLSFIYDELGNNFNDYNIKIKSENDYYFICNLTNLLILINKIFIKRDNIFLLENSCFYDIFFKLIKLLEKTGLLYSNYCFEFEDNYGKIISEICYDLFIYFLNYSFKEEIRKIFKDIFIKENRQLKEHYTIFYLIDLTKEEIIDKEKKTKKELMKYITEYPSLRYIHNNIFSCKDTKKKINIFGKKISQIEGVNFVIYFLSKTFLYLQSDLSPELSNLLLDYFLPKIAANIFKLWTANNSFYGHKICKRFLLYSEAKSFFEAHVIQEPDNFEIYKEFFEKDIPIKLKGQYKLTSCFASRLLDNKKEDDFVDNKAYIGEGEVYNNRSRKSLPIIQQKKITFLNSFGLNYANCFSSFEKLEKKYIIYNPKNFLMKKIFSLSFKDTFFKDKVFQKIRSAFICKYRNYKSLIISSKQLNYPNRQKNFSNSLEPRTFLRRDYNFYNETFFSVSHKYISIDLIRKSDIKNLYFYPHDYYSYNIFNNKDLTFYCEIVTSQFLYFGKIYIGDDFICFESEKDPRDNEMIDLQTYCKYLFSTRDNDNKANKQKNIIIFVKDIKEIVRRRTLLMNLSVEIFMKNGKSYFLNFFNTNLSEKVFDIFYKLNQKLLLKNKKEFIISKDIKADIKKILSLYKKGEMTNYEYLLHLNKLSTRTYNDLTQYPIFPWLILKIEILYDITNTDNSIIINSLANNDKNENQKNYIRDLKYPVSMQNPAKREQEILKYLDEFKTSKYAYHCGTHYSTSSYIFYYLMRINPYGENLIKLQNYKQENPNRMFLSFKETQLILETSTDNRELIPDIYCYIDYLCNLNCSFYGIRNNSTIVDDFYIYDEDFKEFDKYSNLISTLVESLYRHKQLLNYKITPKNLDNWVDIVFGKKQLPNKDEVCHSCNTFNKLTYEQKIKLEKKLAKYLNLLEKGAIKESKLKFKLQNKINVITNFGICPSQIINETLNFEEGPSQIKSNKKSKMKKLKGNYYYFTKITKNQYLSISENLNKGAPMKRNVYIYENNIEKEKNIYHCGTLENNIKLMYKNYENELYKPNYAISEIILINEVNQAKEILILTCRFLGNYFKVQNSDKSVMILCEDFVTTIMARHSEENDNIFYTGLKNGKLIEWKIKLIYNNLNNKKKNQSSSFIIKEKKHVYAHKSSITAIEINNSKNIIATSGEDKFIYIRKIYDFEILTSIDLTYSFGNPIISKTPHIFPSLIKISDLNCIYVLLYDLSSHRTMIRGYTLNGLFFAQTDEFTQGDGRDLFNNISFNKNWNLIVGLYNLKIFLLKSYDLKPKCQKRIIEDDKKNIHKEIKWLEYDSSAKEFIILYDSECQIMSLKDDEQLLFDS